MSRIAREDEFSNYDPVVDELLRILMDLQIIHNSFLVEASMAENATPAIEAATGVATSIVRIMSSLRARGYEFPESI